MGKDVYFSVRASGERPFVTSSRTGCLTRRVRIQRSALFGTEIQGADVNAMSKAC